MFFQRFSLFLTLVLFCLNASSTPHEHSPDPKRKIEESKATNDTVEKEYLLLSPDSATIPKTATSKTKYYPYTQAMSPMIGILLNAQDIGGATQVLYKIDYLIPKFRSPQLEIGVDLSSNSTGFFNIAYRWIHKERSYFRPYFKIGMSHNIIPDEKLASFTNSDNYYLLAGAGLEDLLSPPMSVRLEIHSIIGLRFIGLGLSFGYSWGW